MIVLTLLFLLASQEDEALAQFKKDYASSKIEDRAAAVKTLGGTHGEKVLRRLAELLGADQPPVRIEAARSLGGFQEKELSLKAASALVNGLAANKEESVQTQILKSLGALKEEAAAAAVNKFLEAKDAGVAEAAAYAAGDIRSKSSIPPLIDLLLKIERETKLGKSASKTAGLGNVPGNPAKDANKEIQERKKKVEPATIKALQSITKEKFTQGKDWDDWWKANGATFKVEK